MTATPRGDGIPVPSSRWPFRHVAFVLGVTAFGAGAPTPLYAVYEQQYHFSSAVLAGVFAAYTAGVLVTMLLIAPLSDTVGRKPVLYLGMVLTVVSALVFIFATGVLTLGLARFVSGLAVGATTSTATATMASLEPRRDQHHVARVSVASNFGAVASGVLLSGILVEYAPLPTDLIYLVLIGASLLGIGLLSTTPETVARPAVRSALRIQRISVPKEIRRPFWVAAGAVAACYAIYGYFAAIAPTFLRVSLGVVNRADSAGVIAIMFGLAAIIQLGLGEVRDRRGLLIGLPLIFGATIILTVSVPLTSLAVLGVGAAALGIGVGYAYMGAVTLADRVSPTELRGEILSAFYVVGYLALAVPTIGIGETAVQLGLSAAAITFGLALGLSVAVLYVLTLHTPTPAGGEGRPRSRT
jgi:predicted MFS family arabinose efflux permease